MTAPETDWRALTTEQVARIIDPHGWALWPDDEPAPRGDIVAGQKRVRAPSLRKARAILAIIDARAEALANELRGELEATGWLYVGDDGIEWNAQHPVESGEMPDAHLIRPGTPANLLQALKDAWASNNDAIQSEGRLRDWFSTERARAEAAELRATTAEGELKAGFDAMDPDRDWEGMSLAVAIREHVEEHIEVWISEKDHWRTLAVERQAQHEADHRVIEGLRGALERTVDNFRRAVAGKPVRDMAETLAEAASALLEGGIGLEKTDSKVSP